MSLLIKTHVVIWTFKGQHWYHYHDVNKTPRMRENKAQAQVRRLKMRRDELLAMMQEPTQPRP